MTTHSDIAAVVFDIGNVLIGWQPEQVYDARIGVEKRRMLFDDVPLLAVNDAVDMGVEFHAVFTELAQMHPKWRDEILFWRDNWIELAAPAIPHSVRLLRALRQKGIPVLALSNFGIDTFAWARRVYPFLDDFDQRYISGHLRCMKPDPAIYEMLEVQSGIAPDTLLFADDRPDNIKVANARGWHTHLFQSPDGWSDCLVSHGLLTEAEAA